MKSFSNGGPPLLDPVEDMKIKEGHLKEVVKKIEAYQERQVSHPLKKNPDLEKICKIYEGKMEVSLHFCNWSLDIGQDGILRYCTVLCCKFVLCEIGLKYVPHSTVSYSTVQCYIVIYCAMLYVTAQCSIVQYCTTVQYLLTFFYRVGHAFLGLWTLIVQYSTVYS